MNFSANRLPADQGKNKMLRSFLLTLTVVGMALVGQSGVAAADDDGAVISPAPNMTFVEQSGVVRQIKVGLNKALVIDLPRDARDILVSNPVIADAVIRTPRRIYVTGVAVGQSNVIVFDRGGQQIVSLELEVERDTGGLAQMLNRLIPGSSIDVEMVSDNIILTGSVRNAADARKAQDIASIFANGGAQVQTAAAASGAATGSDAPSSSIINMLTIEGEDQVQLRVTVAEVQRNIAKQLGINLNGAINIGPVSAGFRTSLPFPVNGQMSTSAAFGGAGNLDAGLTTMENGINVALRALEQTGMVRTLAEPTLTAISGESADFLAGGEFPVQVSDGTTNSVMYKDWGVKLSFTPVVLSEGRISLKVNTEVSALTTEGANDFGPGLSTRRASSTLELPSGGSIVLGGLLQDQIRQTVAAIPALGKLPILGTLFRSRDYQRNETELVIIITPYLVSPVSRNALATPDQGFAPASDAQSMFLGNLNRVYGGPSDKPASYAAEKYEGSFGFIFE